MSIRGSVFRLPGMLVAIAFMLVASVVMAGGPESCIVGNNDYTISIVSSGGQFPIVINDNNSDVNNYCGNTSMDNYPCTVFRYTVSPNKPTNELSIGYQKGTITLPICPDTPLEVLNVGVGGGAPHDVYSPCDTDHQPHHWYDGVCGSKAAYYTSFGGGSGVSSFYLAVKGRDVGIGVISAFLSDQDVFYRCANTDAAGAVLGGILGPGCQGKTCAQSLAKVKTLCSAVEGTNYRVDLDDNGIPTEIRDCGTDTQCATCGEPMTATSVSTTDACMVFEEDPTHHCWSLAELGSANQTGYAAFADSPGCVLMNIGGRLTLVGIGCK